MKQISRFLLPVFLVVAGLVPASGIKARAAMLDADTVNIEVTADWIGDQGKPRPDFVRLDIDKDDKAYAALNFTATSGWKRTLTNVSNRDANGKPYDWSIEEYWMPEQYTYTVQETVDAATNTLRFHITNIWSAGEVAVEKKLSQPDAPTKYDFSFRTNIYQNKNGQDIEQKRITLPIQYSDGSTGTVKSGDVIKLKAGQYVTVENVPAGWAVAFVETALPAGFRLSDITGDGESKDLKKGSVIIRAKANVKKSVTFVNYYDHRSPAVWQPKATKRLEGGVLESGQFRFELTDRDTGDIVSEAANDADGSVIFDAIEYDAPGQHAYSMQEITAPSDTDLAWDSRVFDIDVTITEADDGSLVLETDEGDAGPVFVNRVLQDQDMPLTGRFGISAAVITGIGLIGIGIIDVIRKRQ